MASKHIGLRCVLILSLILSITIVTGHTIYRRDSESNEDGEADKKNILRSLSDMIKSSALKIKECAKSGYNYVKSKMIVEENRSSENLTSRDNEDGIVFESDNENDVTAATTIDEDKMEENSTPPIILNRSLLDTPIACAGGEKLGKDGKCRVVW